MATLADLTTQIEELLERATTTTQLTMAARRVIDQIQSKVPQMIEEDTTTLAMTGASLYTLPTGLAQKDILDVRFVGEDGHVSDLDKGERIEVMRESDGTPDDGIPTRYSFPSSTQIQLNTAPATGNTLKFYHRAYAGTITTSTDVSYEAFFIGVVAWLAKHRFEDTRAKRFDEEFALAIKEMFQTDIERSSDVSGGDDDEIYSRGEL